MKKFNQMTENHMSNVNGGNPLIVLPMFAAICGAIGLSKTIASFARNK